MAGIAYTVAERNARESGLDAMRGPTNPQQSYQGQSYNEGLRAGAGYNGHSNRNSYASGEAYNAYPVDRNSHQSLAGLGAAAIPPGVSTPGSRTPSRSPQSSSNNDVYTDDPYQTYARPQDPHLGVVNPNDIEDDGDEGLEYGRRGPRTSMLSLGGGSSHRGRDGAVAVGAIGGAAAASGVMGALGGMVGRNNRGGGGGQYDPVYNATAAYQGGGGHPGAHSLGAIGSREEKSAWLASQKKGSKKWKLTLIIGIILAVIAGIVCGVLFGVVFRKGGSGDDGANDGSQTADGDTAANGDLGIGSPQIKSLLNNPNLHKVFPGVDYTPLNTQYPDCLHNPPSQNNITRDIAVLSQLTNTIRLYGTDCNQTEMAIHALKKLKMDDTVQIWMGVWQDNNATTNKRQLDQMWTILDTYGAKPFKGIIVANEILFREQMTEWELGQLLSEVRTNLTKKDMSLPVATSDLGDKWTASLAQQSDYVMANIHPFFGGINANAAAQWTEDFWQNNNGPYFKKDKSRNVISETGWPSQGGTNCGTDTVTVCPKASVAGIEEMNRFMADWVCSALSNGTEYFWFEAFDEPWKISFNEKNKNWEDHWGLMDVNRKLKNGVKIPDCGGATVR